MRVVLIGTVESTVVTLEALISVGIKPVLLIGLDKLNKSMHSDYINMENYSDKYSIPYLSVTSINELHVISQIKLQKPDWLIVVGWSQIAKPELLEVPVIGSIGYHPSPLPELRGRAVLAWTILLDRKRTAGTLFKLAREVDSGDILSQKYFVVDERETLTSLMMKHMSVLKEMWQDLGPRLFRPKLSGQPQDESAASFCAKRTAEDGLVCWWDEATEVDRLVRAVTKPYPGAFGWYNEKKIRFWRTEPWSEKQIYGVPGQVVHTMQDGFLVACGSHTILKVCEWTIEGSNQSVIPRIGERISPKG